MTRLMTLFAAAAVVSLGGGLGSADEPPREKAPVTKKEIERDYDQQTRVSGARAAQDLAQLQQAEAVLKRATAERARADELFARGAITPADRDATHAAEALARIGATQSRRLSDKSAGESRTAQERFAFAARRNGADITGILAVEVVFPDTARPKVADATRGLIDAATFVTDGTPAAWDAAKRLPHVHVRFPTPHRAVKAKDVRDVALAEALVLLPLTREPGGSVLVRSGERVVRFAKYPHAECVRFQEALAAATPAAR
jgi:hypothetical protein